MKKQVIFTLDFSWLVHLNGTCPISANYDNIFCSMVIPLKLYLLQKIHLGSIFNVTLNYLKTLRKSFHTLNRMFTITLIALLDLGKH